MKICKKNLYLKLLLVILKQKQWVLHIKTNTHTR